MLMMLPPPARRNAGTAYLHITKAPVRLTAMALFQSSSESVSTVPSGVTVAATLTSVVSLPKLATVRSTASFALASSVTSTSSANAGPPLPAMDLATASGDQGDPLRQPAPARHQLVACWTKLPSKIADLGGNGFLIKPISTS